MARTILTDTDIDQVVGGSIMFNSDHTTCGRKCTDQYKVLDYNKCIEYIASNSSDMNEKTMLSNLVAAGYLANL